MHRPGGYSELRSTQRSAIRLESERRETRETVHHRYANAAPQIVNGKPYPAIQWGITKAQCRLILTELREMVKDGTWDEKATVYTLVEDFIKPRTAGKGHGYALLLNEEEPLQVNTMVSHAWAEGAMEFLEAIIRSALDDDVLFICAFSLYQNEDMDTCTIAKQLGSQPEDSPFRSSLEFIQGNGQANWYTSMWYNYQWTSGRVAALLYFSFLLALLTPSVLDGVVPTFYYSAKKVKVCLEPNITSLKDCNNFSHEWVWSPIWPWFRICLPLAIFLLVLLLVLRIMMKFFNPYQGRMIVVPNRNEDLYSRLWCVYEIFIARKLEVPIVLAQSMASAGKASSEQARCFNANDKERILREIEDWFEGDLDKGFEKIDKAIKAVKDGVAIGMTWYFFEYIFPIVFIGLAHYNLFDPNDCRVEFWGDTLGLMLSVSSLVYFYYAAFKRHQGSCPARHLFLIVGIQSLVAGACYVMRRLTEDIKTECDGTFSAHEAKGLTLAFINGFAKSMSSSLTVSGIFILIVLAYSYFDRSPRAFNRKPWQLVLFVASLVTIGYLHMFTINPERMTCGNIANWYQLMPELYIHAVFIFAVLFLPINAIWGAAIHWGLVITWDSDVPDVKDHSDSESDDVEAFD